MGVLNMKRLSFMLAAVAGLAISASSALADSTIKMVEVITSPPRTEFLKKQIAEFEAANPGIKVELVSLPWGQAFEKFLTMVQAGDTPDIVEMPERWMGLYANNGQLEDLGPYMAKWDDAKTLGERAKQFGSTVNNTQYMIPYGYYLNALFWNKKLFKEAGLDGPPATLDEFIEDAKKISALPGKYGYCLRGGPGGFNGMHMFMNIADGKGGYFNADGTSTINDPGSVKGLQMLADIYKNGLAPKDAVSWGFNETVTGFYSGTCAMLNQDPDALLGIADKMSADDFAVAPMPVGPTGKSYPTLGYAGWAMFANSQHKDECLEADGDASVAQGQSGMGQGSRRHPDPQWRRPGRPLQDRAIQGLVHRVEQRQVRNGDAADPSGKPRQLRRPGGHQELPGSPAWPEDSQGRGGRMGCFPDQGTAGLDGQEQEVGAPPSHRSGHEGPREACWLGAAPHLPAGIFSP